MRPRALIADPHADIDALPMNRESLQKALNSVFRSVFQWLATENNQPSDIFCIGASQPSEEDVKYMKEILYGELLDRTDWKN